MSSIRFRAANQNLHASEVAAIRRVCELSISEIQRRAAKSEWLFEIPIFSADWPKSKARLTDLLKAIEKGDLALLVSEFAETTGVDEPLSVTQAYERLQYYHEIAQEQDRLTRLETGQISTPEDYTPPNDHDT